MALVVLSLGALVALLAGKRSSAPIPQGPPVEFADVSARVGLDLSPSFSWSIAWGDADGDDDPDLWLGNHFERGQYFLNAQGSFELRFETEKLDTHGIAWADFDNDGDRDLIELTGANVGRGQSANRLFLTLRENSSSRRRDMGSIMHMGAADARCGWTMIMTAISICWY